MPTALLIGGPKELHGQTREVEDRDRVLIETEPARLSRIPFVGAVMETPAETVAYVRCDHIVGVNKMVYVAEGYEPTPEDEEVVRGWLGQLH